ncbi:hypothetical protein FRC04_008843 [Tulasnella sp. 424]|nr:hypothetical protein FRC04_008843 [Tulasnella sp. 424]KAG8973745.1 hypothetical protein FRC05_008164 [Tulasnella sp. 425]
MEMRLTILDALDDLSSTRSSLSRRSRALNSLERLLAEICIAQDKGQMDRFLELQRGFEGNIASRLLTSLAMCLPALQQLLTSSSSQDPKTASDSTAIAQHTQQALSILQGVALIHAESKAFLGRKSSIHLLLDILSISRHAPSQNVTSADPSSGGSNPTPLPDAPTLASAVLDTLLCVLVDSPPALRVFEEASGVEAVVKTLKRTGVAREVRLVSMATISLPPKTYELFIFSMKCLEFLYFYLLPEDGTPPVNSRCTSSPMRPPVVDTSFSKSIMSAQSKSVPGSPMNFGAYPTPLPIPLSHTPQSSFVENDLQLSSNTNSQSNARPSTPTRTSRELSAKEASETTRSSALQMLQQEIDFVPVSPKKTQVAQLGVGTPGKPRILNLNRDSAAGTPVSKKSGEAIGSSARPLIFPSFSPSTPAKKKPGLMRPAELRLKGESVSTPVKEGKGTEARSSSSRGSALASGKKEALSRSGSSNVFEESTNKSRTSTPPSPTKPSQLSAAANWPSSHPISQQQKPRIRSTEEKKELLGNWLGNVDALVAGVQKAGVWGLA